MSIDEKLEKRLLNIAFGEANDSSDWIHDKFLEKENYHYGPELVDIDPEDAKTVEEVKSFTLHSDLSAIEVIEFERQE